MRFYKPSLRNAIHKKIHVLFFFQVALNVDIKKFEGSSF